MIYYFVSAAHRYTIDRLLEKRAGSLPVRIVPVTYRELFAGIALDPATFIFSDLERLAPAQLGAAERIWRMLSQSGRRVGLLNRPAGVLRRFDLLRELYARGINDFNVYRPADAHQVRRFPVFIRRERDHRGSETPLLHSAAELEAALRALAVSGDRDPRIIVEFHAAADSGGSYRIYGAQCIGDTVIPRSVAFSRHWVVKRTTVPIDENLLAIEREYLATNPHAAFVRRVFKIAHIDYGRMDYTVIDGRPQVYEINTNPTLFYRTATRRHETHFPDLPSRIDQMLAAFAALDARRTTGRTRVPNDIARDG